MFAAAELNSREILPHQRMPRTARGRCLNGRGWTHLGLPAPVKAQDGLFD